MVARVLIIGGGGNFGSYIARAPLLKPRLLIVDEPVSMVDASLRDDPGDAVQPAARPRDVEHLHHP